jgi:hypothetical protein
MTDTLFIDLAKTLFLSALLVVLVRDWLIDIVFYSRNNWNWVQNSGRGLLNGALPTLGKTSSNRNRVFFGLPFFILVVVILLLGTYNS